MNFFILASLLGLTVSCANLYKERAYVSDISESTLKGECGSSGAQNRFSIETRKGTVYFSTPVHYDYWWTGPIIFPLFPLNKERPDPSFIKLTLIAKKGVLERSQLLKSEIIVQNVTEPVMPMNVVYTADKAMEKFVIQFDSPKLVDLDSFRLKLDEAILSSPLSFRLGHDVHYVPIVPVEGGDCVTD